MGNKYGTKKALNSATFYKSSNNLFCFCKHSDFSGYAQGYMPH